MRMFLFVCSILVSLAAGSASAADRTEAQCDALITQAFRGQGEEIYRAMNSRAVQKCFTQYPGLNYKFFPLRSDANGQICDRGPQAVAGTGKCPQRSNPAFTIHLK